MLRRASGLLRRVFPVLADSPHLAPDGVSRLVGCALLNLHGRHPRSPWEQLMVSLRRVSVRERDCASVRWLDDDGDEIALRAAEGEGVVYALNGDDRPPSRRVIVGNGMLLLPDIDREIGLPADPRHRGWVDPEPGDSDGRAFLYFNNYNMIS
eukprot:gene3985-34979_t